MGLVLMVYLVWISVRFYRSGQREKATPMLLALGLSTAAIISDTAVNLGTFDFIYIMEYAYLGVVMVMTYYLSTAVVENAQVRESLRESEGRYRALVETVHGWMWEADTRGVYVYVSPGVRDVLGYEPEELLGRRPFDLMPPEKSERMKNVFKTLAAAQSPIKALETINVHKDGRPITLETSGAPFFDEQGALLGYRGIARDVTRQRLAEAEREQLQQEVIDAQRQTLRDLSTPIIPVMDTPQGNIIVVPLIGSIDNERARDITRSLLAGIREHQAAVVILDITGVPVVDSEVANHLNKTIQTARLKGARAIVTGVSEAVAETIVDLGIDWGKIDTLSDLQSGLIVALNSLGVKLTQ
jgi:rsbT co-antagonist protein RsbR